MNVSVLPDHPPFARRLTVQVLAVLLTGMVRAQFWEPLGPTERNWPCTGQGSLPALALDAVGRPVVAFRDHAQEGRLSVSRWDGSAWIPVGPPGFSEGTVLHLDLALGPDGYPWVAFPDAVHELRTTVMRWDGTAWTTVGQAGFSAAIATFQSLAMGPNGEPFVAYRDGHHGTRTTVMRWTGESWDPVGEPGFSAGWSAYHSLAVDANGLPVVAYQDASLGHRTAVMRWDGATWSAVGPPTISVAEAEHQSLALGPDGHPMVAYRDGFHGGRTTVRRWDGSGWNNVGNPGFSALQAYAQRLALGAGGEPFTAFWEREQNGYHRLVVRHYTNGVWQPLADPLHPSETAGPLGLAVGPDGQPVIAYLNNTAFHAPMRVRRWSGDRWTTVGAIGVREEVFGDPVMAMAPEGHPVMVFSDHSHAGRATGLRWDGGEWTGVGLPGQASTLSVQSQLRMTVAPNGDVLVAAPGGQGVDVKRWNGSAWSLVGELETSGSDRFSLVVDAQSNPMIAFTSGSGMELTVKRWNGTAWQPVGPTGIVDGPAQGLRLAVDAGDLPVVAFVDGANGGGITVMRWDGTAWTTVGAPSFTDGPASGLDMVMGGDGHPLVVYRDGAHDDRLTMMRWEGGDWAVVGSPGISEGAVGAAAVQVDPFGRPVVAYRDGVQGNRITVMRWDGAAWTPLGGPGFSLHPVSMTFLQEDWLTIDDAGNVLVAYLGPGGLFVERYQDLWVNTGSLAGPLCAGQQLEVSYIVNGGFSAGNIFSVELSGPDGGFDEPVTIGELNSTTNGVILATIPQSTPAGNGYRIRVVASEPPAMGMDNGTDLTIMAATAWYADADGDGYGDPGNVAWSCAELAGYVTNGDDCNDADPTITIPGQACDPGPGFVNGILGDDCICTGLPLPECVHELMLDIVTDAHGSDLAWRLESADGVPMCGDVGLPPSATMSVSCCLPDGCYRLVVTDAGGDGIAGGGYVLRTVDGRRIIDNTGNFLTGEVSSVADGFCLPMGDDRPIWTSCDRTWWQSGNYLVATENPAVSAAYGVTNPTSGYEFWFFDPNGGLSFRKFRDHATSDGYGPDNALRACHIQLNNWALAHHLQDHVLYNVRVRGVIDGVSLPFGPACRVVLDPEAADCPPTGLNDLPYHAHFSCGVTRAFGGPNSALNSLHARSVAGADRYAFEFAHPTEGHLLTVESNTVLCHLNWSAQPHLAAGSTYLVRVRASRDGGDTWCEWGWTCPVTIDQVVSVTDRDRVPAHDLRLWPNPNSTGGGWMAIDGLIGAPFALRVEVHDLRGKQVVGRELEGRSGAFHMDLGGVAAGTYVVTVITGHHRYFQRLVITDHEQPMGRGTGW